MASQHQYSDPDPRLRALLTLVAAGVSLSVAYHEAGVTRSTVGRVLRTSPPFREKFEHAKKAGRLNPIRVDD
ncbi:hypothetical protein ACIQC7_34765 [Kitasatospora sp. NPDC088556]|uniref:hypothetical protein n=1 Tax=Kitasatospora sp. NPDC088556 TaxID=3364076 RepID=UPI0037F9A1D0